MSESLLHLIEEKTKSSLEGVNAYQVKSSLPFGDAELADNGIGNEGVGGKHTGQQYGGDE